MASVQSLKTCFECYARQTRIYHDRVKIGENLEEKKLVVQLFN